MKNILLAVISSLCITIIFADVHEIQKYSTTTTTPSPPPRPYVFSYSAGRAPGHIDRSHTEVSDGSGTVRGSFSYVDPKFQVRTVQYVADEYGFHPQLSHEPQDTEANRRAAAKHFALYDKIAKAHSNPEIDIAVAASPLDTESVAYAKNKHYNLYEKIAAEHARIAAERESQRLILEQTSQPNHIDNDHQLLLNH